MIKIVGLGPGSPEALTIGAVEALQESKNLYFRTEKHPTVDYLKNRLEYFKTCDNYYEEGGSFDEVYSNIAKNMIEEYKVAGELVYAVPGHPLVAERSVLNLINLCKENDIEYKILPAVSFVDAMMDRLQIDPIEGLKIIDAFDISNQILDKRIGTIITQVYNPLIASEVKLELLEYYHDETEIYYVRAAGIEGERTMAFFDELGKKISVTGQNVMQKAKGMADITSLKSQINEEQKKIDKYCQNLGHMYYELKQNDPEPQLAELVRMVQASYQRIEAIRSEIEAIESIKTCPRCGAVLEPGMAFCVGCGAKVEDMKEGMQASQQQVRFCIKCGKQIPQGAVFCTKCGTKQE